MKFSEPAVEELDIKAPEALVQLVSLLCGQETTAVCQTSKGERCTKCQGCRNFSLIQTLCKTEDWSHTKLNQVLLLLNEPTVTRDFYSLFFGEQGTHESLKRGVVKFRGYAMLAYGSFRFAYKHLAPLDEHGLRNSLRQHIIHPNDLRDRFERRHTRRSLVNEIPDKNRWYLGYISGVRAKQDFASLAALHVIAGEKRSEVEGQLHLDNEGRKLLDKRLSQLKHIELSPWRKRWKDLKETLENMQKEILETQEIGLANTSAYLTSDHLDVYVATSMRESWEFETTGTFLREVFQADNLERLKLRYFDPTLSFQRDRIDKGLVEGLMLKRAKCTLYMIQETDTLGKDSELASTLAQGKPVIAYVPNLESAEVARELRASALRHLRKRAMLLLSEDAFSGEGLATIVEFMREAVKFSPVFALVGPEEREFMHANAAMLRDVRRILASAESTYRDKRARDLMQNHPLAIQVHLETGVANGVLVVRSARDCANLLAKLLTNDGEFMIEREGGAYVLRERISGCPFRVVTDDPTLTNSFWNFYSL